MAHLEELAALGVDHVILIGPTFELAHELDGLLDLVDDIHAVGT